MHINLEAISLALALMPLLTLALIAATIWHENRRIAPEGVQAATTEPAFGDLKAAAERLKAEFEPQRVKCRQDRCDCASNVCAAD